MFGRNFIFYLWLSIGFNCPANLYDNLYLKENNKRMENFLEDTILSLFYKLKFSFLEVTGPRLVRAVVEGETTNPEPCLAGTMG